MKISKLFVSITAVSLLFLAGPVSAASATTGHSDSAESSSIMKLVEGTDFQVLTPEQSKFLDDNFGERAVSLSEAQSVAQGKVHSTSTIETAGDVSPLSSCLNWKNAVALIGKQFTNTDMNCALIGGGLGKKTYYWEKDLNANGSVCVQGKGYTTGSEQWIIGGCGPSGSVTANWRNAMAHPAIKHEAGVAPIYGVAFRWS